jgi:hypothetical protein
MKKVAIYKDVKFGSELIREVSDWIEESSEYVRLSVIVEVDPAPLPREVVVAEEVAALHLAISQIEAKAYDATASIKARIQELLALPESV